MADLVELQKTLGVSFRDTARLEEALVHGSYLNENAGPALTSNQRLEFLGDAVLGLVIAEKLFQDFPGFPEGEMTKRRADLVRRETLGRLASGIHLGDYLLMGRGEESGGGRSKTANLACALEAVIGAVFLDGGLELAGDFILRLFRVEIDTAVNRGSNTDYKTELQQLVQSSRSPAPVYTLLETKGAEHNKTFVVEVTAGGSVRGTGSGKSKKAAEAEAARSALEQLRR